MSKRKTKILCPRCFGTASKKLDVIKANGIGYIKKCAYCGYRGPGIEIDSGLKLAIWNLNTCGIYTKFCCEGHINSDGEIISTPYIMIEPYVIKSDEELDKLIHSLPDSWKYDYDPYITNPGITIRGDMINYPDYLKDINEWASNVHCYIFEKEKADLLN